MDYKKVNAPTSTISRDMNQLSENIGNVYETVKIISKRANQISVELKQEIDKKLQDFTNTSENIEEVFENREQIEISRYYEKLPKAVLMATQEFIEDKVYYRNPLKDKNIWSLYIGWIQLKGHKDSFFVTFYFLRNNFKTIFVFLCFWGRLIAIPRLLMLNSFIKRMLC